MANGDTLCSDGEGTVMAKFIVGDRESLDVVLENVLYVPKLQGSLLSVKQLMDKGFSVVFKDDRCYLSKDGDSLLIARCEKGLFRVKNKQEDFSLATRTNNAMCVHEWHLVLAHRNLQDIHRMKSQGLCVKNCECSDVCEPCIKGKMSVKPFPRKATPTTAVMDCVVTDVCGPLSVASVGHSRYFITFTDLYSKYTEVYFMKTKDETFQRIKQYVEKVKNQLGKKPKIIRSDRGREYYNKDVLEYLSNEGISFQCTVGYAPQQNGVSERKNRTLMEGARTLLIDAKLGKHFWAEAVRHLNYVFNRLLPQGYEKTPYEMFYGKVPAYDDIHRFGCDVYTMVPYEKRRKIDNKAKKMIYIGNDDVSKGFRVADTQSRGLSVSRNVKFLDERKIEGRPNTDVEDLDMEVDDDVVEERQEEELQTPQEGHSASDELEKEEMEVDFDEEIPMDEEILDEGPRRSSRANAGKNPSHLDDYHVYSSVQEEKWDEPRKYFEPKTYREATNCPEKDKWNEAMKEELNSIQVNETWVATDLPANRQAIGCKWVYKLKFDEKGNVVQHKARLVAQGFSQKFGKDYDEVFAPVASSVTFKLLLSVAGVRRFTVKHFDVKTAFLNGVLEEEIYMRQPPGFEGDGKKVLKLRKSINGLKQAARVWNKALNTALEKCGFVQSKNDRCLYTLKRNDDVCYVLIHVDDLLVASSNEELIDDVFDRLSGNFELKTCGEVTHYLGINVTRDSNRHFLIDQRSYIDKIVEEAGLKDAKVSKFPLDIGYFKNVGNQPLQTNDHYRKIIGMLLYLSTNTRPDIAASVAILSQKVARPTNYDLNELKRVIRYLKGTRSLRLRLSSECSGEELYAYSDANWAEDKSDRRSNSGYFMSINGGAVGWSCRKQQLVSLSSTESELVALSETTKELVWLKRLCEDFEINVSHATPVYTDSQSCLKMIENDGHSNRTKHIDTRFHFTRDMVRDSEIKLIYCTTEENIADMLTKPLGSVRLAKLRTKAFMVSHN